MGHVGSKTRSLGQILEKPCVRSRGHIFSPILILGQNVCIDEITDKLKSGPFRVKTSSLGKILQKPCVRFRGHIINSIIMKVGQNLS